MRSRPVCVFARLAPVFASLLALGAWPSSLPASVPPDYELRQLTPSGEPTSRVGSAWEIDPNGDWVAFVGDVEIAGAEAVYALRRNGAELHRLSAYAPANAISSLRFSADGRRVIYRGDLEVDGRNELWSAPPWGSVASAVKLNVPVVGAGVATFRVSPVGDRIAYVAETASGLQVWSVPASGTSGSGVHLDPSLGATETPQTVVFRPDGAQVVIQVVDQVAATTRLFAVPAAGPASQALLLADTDPGGCPAAAADYTPDGSRLLFARLCLDGTDYRFNQLWSVPADGPAEAAVSLAGSFAVGGQIQSLVLSPDGEHVVFVADKLVDERFELWSVPVAGPAAALVRLNPTLVTNGDVKANFAISPDGTRVAYIADQASDERYFPYSVPIDGPSTEAVSLYQGVLTVAADAQEVAFTPDGSRVVFRFDLAVDERFDLYWAPPDASASQVRITNRGVAPARSVAPTWRFLPDSERVVYLFDESTPGDQRGIGEQRIDDPYATDARWNGPPVAGGAVTRVDLYPDGYGFLYRADQALDQKFELFTVDLRLFADGFESADFGAWSDTP
ncbi:MAG: hypothetical protein U0X73_09220 [Thermoanaerobaculia bacterium]